MRDWNAATRAIKRACSPEYVTVYERKYAVTHKFRDHEHGLRRANEVMAADRTVGCIAIKDGWIYLVKLDDKGI